MPLVRVTLINIHPHPDIGMLVYDDLEKSATIYSFSTTVGEKWASGFLSTTEHKHEAFYLERKHVHAFDIREALFDNQRR